MGEKERTVYKRSEYSAEIVKPTSSQRRTKETRSKSHHYDMRYRQKQEKHHDTLVRIENHNIRTENKTYLVL